MGRQEIDLDKQKGRIEKRIQYTEALLTRAGQTAGVKPLVLSNLTRAMQKIHMGVYSVCDVCEKQIDAQRLLTIPGAINCRSCQEKIEINRKRHLPGLSRTPYQ